MAVIHIPEAEAAKDLHAVMTRVERGETIVIDGATASVRMVPEVPKLRTGHEILAILDSLPGERGVMDDDFARDVMEFRKRHPGGLDGSKWD